MIKVTGPPSDAAAKEALPDPDFPPGEMYIMGEYVHDNLGRYILLYYGSFAALLEEEDEEVWKDEIFATVAHEFTHHLEEAAGLHALDDKDPYSVLWYNVPLCPKYHVFHRASSLPHTAPIVSASPSPLPFQVLGNSS